LTPVGVGGLKNENRKMYKAVVTRLPL